MEFFSYGVHDGGLLIGEAEVVRAELGDLYTLSL